MVGGDPVMSVSFQREEEKPGLHFPIEVKDDQGQLLWEKRTEMTLPAGSFFYSVSQVQPAPRRGVWLAPFFIR